MSAITAQTVNDLRQRTGAGLMDCKKALVEANGDNEKAVEILRIKGVATRNKKADRKASEGILAVQVSADGRASTLLELNCETDFVAKNENFIALAKELVGQAAANGVDGFLDQAYHADKSRKVNIEGHTDERGGREYNLALGQKRAEAVRRALSLLGVPESQMEAVSFGEEKPAQTGLDEGAFAKNRRVELTYR